MSGPEASEGRLVRRWLAGDRAALERLLEAYYPYVLRLCSLMAGEPQLAEEWSQDALLQVASQLHRYDPQRPFKPWLRQVVLNVCRNRREQARLRQRRETSWEALAATSDGPAEREGRRPAEAASQDGAVEQQVLLQEGLRTLERAWARLPAEWRTALWLRAVEGLSYGEIAAAGEWPEGTAKTYVFRARQALRRALFEEVGE
ncbi:RNA polymerase sigma factor [Geochorda subterranea]|uniref:Sigma-70 family RNA polymerase sigma factor n=1 Tax=Geochorda subterranea TaxID=3109564 RepID=A0ABZ1BLI4_9FIRM|nr:sigma-70 family RNA polymerase sigma factor [Limnochorda sp. LNt]WRP13690.1 sigma-70 family RNA polymerase sigma factor [Limnochorda sp. LNt]